MATMFVISEMIGNYSETVGRFDSFYEVQDYLSDRLDVAGIDLDDEIAVQDFYSYFNVESVSADYDYYAAVTEDIIEYIKDNIRLKDFNDVDELREKLYDDLWIADSVTGNASGSYFFNRYKAEKALCGNLNLLSEALEEFCCENAFEYICDPEKADVTIRCYLLGQCIDSAIEELDLKTEFELREENAEISVSVNAPELETA